MQSKQSYLFYKIKYARIVQWLLKWRYKELRKILQQEAKLYRDLLKQAPEGSLIFDIGANLGDISELFVKLGHRVIAIEPAPGNFRCLQARFGSNKKVELVNKAVGADQGLAQLYLQDIGNTLHTLNTRWKNYLSQSSNDRWGRQIHFSNSIEVPVTTISTLMEQYGKPYFIKIDAEGFEWDIISGLKECIPCLSFEANLPEFVEESINCIRQLIVLDPNSLFTYATSDDSQLRNFVSASEMINFLKVTRLRHLDIFCRSVS